ncbi:MAG TPA: hypothetical protein VGI83_09960 [Gemmatimonadales bacterium]
MRRAVRRSAAAWAGSRADAEFFPAPYLGAGPDVLRVVDRVRVLMGIAADRVEVAPAVNVASRDLEAMLLQPGRRTVAAGHYERRGERGYIRIDPIEAGDQSRLVAVAAHEFCHDCCSAVAVCRVRTERITSR